MAPVARLSDDQHQLAQHAGPARAAGRRRAEELLGARCAKRAPVGGPPVFLKVAPDLGDGDPDRIVRVAIDHGIDALIVANTTVVAPAAAVALRRRKRRPVRRAAEAAGARCVARSSARRSGGQMPLIGVGGIASADDAWERIRAGASLVQLYTAMVYEGPGIARRIARGLAERLKREGMASIAEAVGRATA